jgi:hypothetical protein
VLVCVIKNAGDALPPTGTNTISIVGNSSRNKKTKTKVLIQSRHRSQGSSYHPRQPTRHTNILFGKPSSLPQKEEAIRSLNLSLKSLAKSKERGSDRRAEQLFKASNIFWKQGASLSSKKRNRNEMMLPCYSRP